MKARFTIFVSIFALVLTGAGCASTADQVADDAVKPVAVPIEALGDAKDATAKMNAASRRRSDTVGNMLPIAFVLLEGHKVTGADVERVSTATFGCNDKIAYVPVSREDATDDPAYDALATLFAVTDSTVSDLHNSVWESDLSVEKVKGVGQDKVEVHINGEIVSNGVCDDPRIKEQVEATVRQYYPDYTIFLNGSESEWDCFGDGSGLCGI
jgi:hypothetical protein